MKKTLALALLLSIIVTRLGAQVILQDSFTYSDGILTNVSSMVWSNYSGTPDSAVASGRLQVFGTRSGDVYRPFTNIATSPVYASFIVNASNVITTTSNYFAHLSINSTTFRAKVFANPGVSPNTWRLGINGGSSTLINQVYPLDLATNVDYRVVMSYETASQLATLWIDPVDPSDPNKQTTDSPGTGTVGFFSFRQSGPNPNLQVDDLFVGNAFANVVGPAKPPTIYYQPPTGPTTNFTGGNLTLSCVAGGAGKVSFQWQHAGTNLTDDANNTGTSSNQFSIVSATTNQSGAYRCIVTSTTNSVFAGSVTSVVSQVVISVAPVPPTITQQPSSNNLVYAHSTVILHVVASGPPSFSYQWFQNNSAISDSAIFTGTSSDTLTVSDIAVANGNTGTYRVDVTNPYGTTPSSNAVISVTTPAAVSIAYLRSLIDPTTFATTSPSTVAYQVTGIVTSFTNLTSGDTSSYYLQDATAGINIFATFASTFRPQQGDVVTYVGVLSTFTANTGGLELFADTGSRPYTSYTIVSNNFPLPAARTISFTVTNDYGYLYVNTNLLESRVTLTNVYFGARAGTTIVTNANDVVTVTNASGTNFALQFYSMDLDTAGQTLPAYASSVTGILIGNHPSLFLAVTKFSDIVTNAVVLPSPIPLNIQLSGGSVILTWADASFNLLSATNVIGPYTAIGSGTGYSEPVTNTTKFFRLIHP